MNEKIIAWGYQYLSSHGFNITREIPETIQVTPWSNVLRFSTTTGFIYLKQTPKLIALEANIIEILSQHFHVSVPQVIANNIELNCFLMKDAGRPLRDVLKTRFDDELVCAAVNLFSSMQLSVADDIDVFVELGVPDWGLEKLSNLYSQLLNSPLFIEDDLSSNELIEYKALIPTVKHLAYQLSRYSIKPSLVQPDFNDNNVLIEAHSRNLTLIDLGEVAISHPFFSLLNFLYQMQKHHGITENDPAYFKIRDSYLSQYMTFESRDNLLQAIELARPLWFIYRALADERLINACDKATIFKSQRGKIIENFRNFSSIVRKKK